jgi:hypothetical protein
MISNTEIKYLHEVSKEISRSDVHGMETQRKAAHSEERELFITCFSSAMRKRNTDGLLFR